MNDRPRLRFFHHTMMQYPYIPPAGQIESAWLTLPNAHYDPDLGRELVHRSVEQAVLAERLGFDATCVGEHHQTPYGLVADPHTVAAFIAARTERILIGVLGTALPLHADPLRVAESVALLDTLSGGRVLAGFTLGTGMDYHAVRADPVTARRRFWEAHELILRAWSEPGPFLWDSAHYYLPHANPWPRPYQRPHPPVWLAAQPGAPTAPPDPGPGGDPEVDDLAEQAGRRGHPLVTGLVPLAAAAAAHQAHRRASAAAGRGSPPRQHAFHVPVHVGESDAAAHAEARRHIEWMFHTALKVTAPQAGPPGFAAAPGGGARRPLAQLSYDELLADRYVIVGSPETVTDQLAHYARQVGGGVHIGGGTAFGAMAHETVARSMTLFARDVMPRFRDPDPGGPVSGRAAPDETTLEDAVPGTAPAGYHGAAFPSRNPGRSQQTGE